MIEYKELVHILTKDEELLETYSQLDSSLAAEYLLNNVEQNAHITLETLRMLGQIESKAYEKNFEFISSIQFYSYPNTVSNNMLKKGVEEAIKLYKLGRIL